MFKKYLLAKLILSLFIIFVITSCSTTYDVNNSKTLIFPSGIVYWPIIKL